MKKRGQEKMQKVKIGNIRVKFFLHATRKLGVPLFVTREDVKSRILIDAGRFWLKLGNWKGGDIEELFRF